MNEEKVSISDTEITFNNFGDYLSLYEEGKLTDEKVKKLFQYLVDTGMAWKLQGFYGREAQALLEEGIIHERRPAVVAKSLQKIAPMIKMTKPAHINIPLLQKVSPMLEPQNTLLLPVEEPVTIAVALKTIPKKHTYVKKHEEIRRLRA